MTDQKRQPRGLKTGGQYAADSKAESTVALGQEQEIQPALSLQELEFAMRTHGTVHADSTEAYYPAMEKVFAAARAQVEQAPETRRELSLRSRADRLAEYTGIPASEIRDFHEMMSGIEPRTGAWQEKVRVWSQDVWNEPLGTVIHVDDQMRQAEDTPAAPGYPKSRGALLAERSRVEAELGAMDVRETAAGIREQWPDASAVSAWTTGPDDDINVTITDTDGKEIWQGDPNEADGIRHGTFDRVDLCPDDHDLARSPLRTCRIESDASWKFTYNVDNMASLTADDLT